MLALFKADGEETANRYCISEWWLDPKTSGPGAHSHDANDEIFLVLSGTASILVGMEWVDAEAGTVVVIPAGTTHDFRNSTDAEIGIFNIFLPGGFEASMPAILQWYAKNHERA